MRIDVRKTPKLFIGGAFVRSESGRTETYRSNGTSLNVARASRKDLRDAVRAARTAQPGWARKSAYNRGQILYRLAEMIEGSDRKFGVSARELTAAIDRIVWYAGWCDKIEQYLSTKNPVAGPHFNVSSPEPTGVVGVLAPAAPALLGTITAAIPALCAGNAVVLAAPVECASTAIAFAEAIATSDVPPGAFNVLTGIASELSLHMARHMDVNALTFWDLEPELRRQTESLCAENVKRIDAHVKPNLRWWYSDNAQSPHRIAAFMEIKTVWHPAGM